MNDIENDDIKPGRTTAEDDTALAEGTGTEAPESPDAPAPAETTGTDVTESTGEPEAEGTTEEAGETAEAGPEETGEASVPEGSTSLYVRRGRTPTLGFWVTLTLVIPAVAALVISPFFDFADLTGVLNFVLVAVVFVGVPLAAVAAAVDSFLHRPSGPRGR